MIIQHLSDRDIQVYLDGLLAEDDERVHHLAGCADCQMQVKIYKTIYQASSGVPVVIDTMLEEAVMSRIIKPVVKESFMLSDILLFAGIVSGFLMILFFFGNNPGTFLNEMINFFVHNSYRQIILTIFFTGILLIIIQLFDTRLINNYYAKKNLI